MGERSRLDSGVELKVICKLLSYPKYRIRAWVTHLLPPCILVIFHRGFHFSQDTLMMGADHYQTESEIASLLAEGKVPIGIGRNTKIRYKLTIECKLVTVVKE